MKKTSPEQQQQARTNRLQREQLNLLYREIIAAETSEQPMSGFALGLKSERVRIYCALLRVRFADLGTTKQAFNACIKRQLARWNAHVAETKKTHQQQLDVTAF